MKIDKDGIHRDTIIFNDKNMSAEDKMANDMASEILMPTEIFRHKVREHNGNILKLVDEFQVSSLAIIYRAKMLGIEV